MKYTLLIGSSFVFLLLFAQSYNHVLDKGNTYYKEAQYDLAENQYRAVLLHDPTNTTARYNLAIALHRQKKYDEATAVLKRLEQQNISAQLKASAYYNEGVAYSRQKSLEESIEAYKAALRLNPDDQQARENLQKALAELKKQKEEQQKQQQQSSSMSKSEADQKLKQLQEKEKELQERMQNKGQKGNSLPKDW